ncbi:recombinase family protein [Intestinimonas butyriciproducens]|uniref:recombinase family protein n=1 Tax=Intestinimonas butyriciproducens TaxID=1297617 RepID=UPI001FAB65E9|nr:recombinase family protein [Intestinimonas butyriciproducens]
MSKENMLVFGYARVSTDNQLENYSIEEQTERLKAYCAAKGWTLLQTYVDGGYSGGNTDRPALQEMLSAIRENKIDAVVVYKLDRLSRSQKDTLTLIEDELLAHGTDFVSINENFDTSTPFGRAMIGILSVFAQLEKDQITERFTMGRIGRGKAGYFHGGGNPPTGYDYIDGKLVVNEYEAMQVREVFSAFLGGRSINAIQKDLTARYTTKWTAAKVRNVLKNSLYTGKVHFLGQEYQGIHEPIIEESAFRAAVQALSSFEREAQKTTAQRTPFRAGYLLSGLVYCNRCGARYSANHGYYKCYSRAKSSPKFIVDPNCKNDNWAIEDLDALVCRQVDALVLHQDALDSLLAQAVQPKTVKIDKTRLRKRASEIDVQIERLIELYQFSAIPMSTLTEKVNTLSAEKKALQEQLDAPDEVPARELFQMAVSDYSTGFSDGDIAQKRALLSRLVERVTIEGQSVEVHWRL